MSQDFHRFWRFWGWRISCTLRDFDRVSLRRWGIQFQRGMNGLCYCDEGFWLRIECPLGFIWLEGDRIVRPCPCDVAIHDSFHDDHEDCCEVGAQRAAAERAGAA